MARFTSANAREMAARSVAARKAAEAERTAKTASIPLQATPPADADLGISVACVRARLETLDGLMSKAKSDREWDNLTRAYDRLFRVWCVLTKTPGPGNRKPPQERADRRAFLDVHPLGPAPEVPKGGSLDSLPVESPIPAPAAVPTPRPSVVGPVPIGVALCQNPTPLQAPASPAPPSQKTG